MSNRITWNEWEDTYKPIRNPLNKEVGFWGCMFETFGEDYDELITHPTDRVWTLVDNDPNSNYVEIENGYHLVNRLGYFVTEVPWEGDVLVNNDSSD